MRSTTARVCLYGLGIVAIVCAGAGRAFAGLTVAAPEIDGTSISAGLAAATAAVLILRARRRSK